MALKEAIRGRRRIRKFRRNPIPEEVLREILDQARGAPSWGNTQWARRWDIRIPIIP